MQAYKIFYKYEMYRLGNRIKVTDCDIIWADTAKAAIDTIKWNLPEDTSHFVVSQIWKDTGRHWEHVDL